MSASVTSPVVKAKEEKLEGDALFQALKKQVEFYFSRQNLQKDVFLLSQMNDQKYVPVSVIGAFPRVKDLVGEDSSLLIKVMKASNIMTLDKTEEKVRPNFKMERTTLILRNISQTTPVSEINDIFTGPDMVKPESIKADIADTWFVHFKTEDDCTNVAMALLGKTFQDKPLQFRVKSENLQRGFFVPPSSNNGGRYRGNAQNGYMMPVYGGGGYAAGGAGGQYFGGAANSGSGANAASFTPSSYGNGAPGTWAPNQQGSGKASPRRGRNGQTGTPAKGGNNQRNKTQQRNGQTTPGGSNTRQQGARSNKKEARQQNNRKHGEKGNKSSATQLRLGPDDFPALPNAGSKPATGYTKDYKHYSREEMADIVNKLAKTSPALPQQLKTQKSNIMETSSLKACQLLEPMPVMFPASPSPQLAAQMHHSSDLMPYLDLGGVVFAQGGDSNKPMDQARVAAVVGKAQGITADPPAAKRRASQVAGNKGKKETVARGWSQAVGSTKTKTAQKTHNETSSSSSNNNNNNKKDSAAKNTSSKHKNAAKSSNNNSSSSSQHSKQANNANNQSKNKTFVPSTQSGSAVVWGKGKPTAAAILKGEAKAPDDLKTIIIKQSDIAAKNKAVADKEAATKKEKERSSNPKKGKNNKKNNNNNSSGANNNKAKTVAAAAAPVTADAPETTASSDSGDGSLSWAQMAKRAAAVKAAQQ